MINRYPNGGSEFYINTSCLNTIHAIVKNEGITHTSHLQFIQSKSFSRSHFRIVFKGRTSHNGSQPTGCWSWRDCQCLSLSCFTSSLFFAWLVVPSTHISFPVFFEVSVWYYAITPLSHPIKGSTNTTKFQD